jgi:hypothetical protein
MQTGGRGSARYARFAVAAALAALTGCALSHGPAATPRSAPGSPFLVTFWCGPPLADFDDARAAEIAAAGFTVVGAPCQGGFDPALNRRALDTARRHGLRVVVQDRRLAPAASAAADWPAPAYAAVAEYAGHPALAGYFVDDEPTAAEFEPVAAVVAALRAADPRHLAYVNLLPDYVPPAALGAPTYEEYVEHFITTVRPQLLSYDYYPFGHEKDRSTFFANLAVMRAAALRHDLPFLLIVLAMPHGPYRDPSEAELAWQVHHALAYGARGVSYFAYWTPPGDEEWNNRYGLIENGRPTAHYFQVARLNRDLQAVAAALDGFESIAVADSLGDIGVPFPIGPIDGIDGGRITAGLFGDGAGRFAVLLVNRDYRYGVTAQLRLRAGATAPQAFDAGTATWAAPPTLSFVLPPGGSRLLGWGMSGGRCA